MCWWSDAVMKGLIRHLRDDDTFERGMTVAPLARFRRACLMSFAAVVVIVWGAVLIGVRGLERRTIDEASADHRALAQILVEHVGSQIRAIDLAALRLRDVWHDNPAQFAAEVEKQKALLY